MPSPRLTKSLMGMPVRRYSVNFTDSVDDISRFADAAELEQFCKGYGLSGVELMHLRGWVCDEWSVPPALINGLHLVCMEDWMERDRELVKAHYAQEFDYAFAQNANYMVVHASYTPMSSIETLFAGVDDWQVIDEFAALINELLAGREPGPWLLLENLWWSGLNLKDPALTKHLLASIEYPRCGLMFDTGHYFHTDLSIKTQEAGLAAINAMLDAHEQAIPGFMDYVKGVHLQQSVTGEYVEALLADPPVFSNDVDERNGQMYEIAFEMDRHEPFTCAGVRQLVDRIDPRWVTLEYITSTREQLEDYLQQGASALGIKK